MKFEIVMRSKGVEPGTHWSAIDRFDSYEEASGRKKELIQRNGDIHDYKVRRRQ